MRFSTVFSSLMFLGLLSPAFAGITVPTQPKAVTVFPDSARVTREGSLLLEAGTHRVFFTGLPASLIESSLRLTVEGPHGTKLYGVALRKEFTDDVVEERTRLLKDRLLALQDQKTDLADQVEARKTEIEILKRLAKENTEHATLPGLVRPGTIVDFTQSTKSLGQRVAFLMAAVRKDERTMRTLDDKIAALNHQMAEGSEPAREKRAAEADLELPEAGTAKFSLTYQVSGASWTPLYDLRLATEGAKPRMGLDFNAGIRQTTGESWKGVSLTLCTSRPMEGTQVPDPTGWWLDFLNEARGYMDRVGEAANKPAAPGSESFRSKMKKSLMNQEADLEDAKLVTAQTIQSAYAMSFSVPGPRDIPSDGSDHRVGIAQDTHDVQLTLVAVPRLSQAAYLEAKVTYGGEQTLLPGQAQLFRDGDFVGSTFLEAKASGESFDLGFGQDDRIKVERKIASQTTGHAGFLLAKGERKYRWITTLSNFHSGNRLVEVREQLPRSQQKDIKVEATEILPQPQKEDREKPGLICWKLDLKPKEKAKLTFAYKVGYPENGQVIGLE